jgi:hypothetical protein
MNANLLIAAPLVLALSSTATMLVASPSASGTLTPEPSCPPAVNHLLVAPVGAAWIGSFEGVFEPDDGRAPFAVWSISETLVGGPLGEDDSLVYAQPACDAVLSGGIGDDYLVTTADPTSPTTDDTVLWRIDPGGKVALMYPDLDTPLSVYGVETLEAARVLVLSQDMPAGDVPSASAAPVCPIGLVPTPSRSPRPSELASQDPSSRQDRRDARSALQAYYDDVEAQRFAEAWDRLSEQTQAMWGGIDGFKGGPSTKVWTSARRQTTATRCVSG